MKSFFRLIFATLLLLLPCTIFAQTSTSLTIRGDVFKPITLTPEAVKKQFAEELLTRKYVAGQDKKEKTAIGIPLLSVIRAAELKTEATPKHYDMSFIIIIEAHDGYRAYFSLAELMSREHENESKTLLVMEEDGHMLSGNDTPFKLLTTGNDRRIFGITSITLVDGTKLADSLARRD